MQTLSYNRWSRYLHWTIAGLILFMVFLGWRLGDHDSLRLSRVNLHKSTGILILLLSFVRIAVRVAYKAPPEPPMPKWQLWAAKVLHVAFYVVMIGMPLTGWLMVSTSAREIPFFLWQWPHFPGIPVEAHHGPVHETFETLHKLIAKLLIYGMIPLHVLAALKHQFVDKDTVVEHMVPGLTPRPVLNWRWLVPLGVVVVAIGCAELIYRGTPEKDAPAGPPAEGVPDANLSTAPVPAGGSHAGAVSAATPAGVQAGSAGAVTVWTVDKAATGIDFTTDFQGEAVKGAFGAYDAQIAFDPAQLDRSHVKVTIDLASVNSGDGDRDSTLKSDSFFNVAVTPRAVFEASSFTAKNATHFVAHGRLTLHGVTRRQDLPFSLTIAGKAANMSGTTTIDRTAFGVGSGDYASTDTLPARVTVVITLRARAS